jgi:hypothetical protein
MYEFRCFSDFWAEKLARQRVRIGVFVTKTDSWMANHKWSDIPVHAWVGVLGPMAEGGFRLLIFDCSFNKLGSDTVYLDDLHDRQRDFIRYCETKRNLQVNEVWAVGGEDESTDGSLRITSRCLQSTLPNWTTVGEVYMKVNMVEPRP